MVTPCLLEALPPPDEPPPSSEVTPLEQADRTGIATAVPARAPRRVRRFISSSFRFGAPKGARGTARPATTAPQMKDGNPPEGSRRAVSEKESLEGGQAQVQHDGDDSHKHRPAQHLHEIPLGEPVEDVPAQPPKDTYAAMVAVATTWMRARRRPVMIRGSARGNSTWNSTWWPRMPWPRAASFTSGSTAVMLKRRCSSRWTGPRGRPARCTPATSTGRWRGRRGRPGRRSAGRGRRTRG